MVLKDGVGMARYEGCFGKVEWGMRFGVGGRGQEKENGGVSIYLR